MRSFSRKKGTFCFELFHVPSILAAKLFVNHAYSGRQKD